LDFGGSLNSLFSPPQPAGLRNWNAPAFSPLKKYAAHFFNSDCVGTGEKEASYPVTVFKFEEQFE
jgi:hypothetical protein